MSGIADPIPPRFAAPSWLEVGLSAQARARFKAHPAFSSAMVTIAVGMVALYSGNRLLNRVLNDRGRTLFGFFTLYLHALPEAEGGGLTVSRMVALTAETGVCSRGRTKAMLALMRWGGYLAPGETAADRRAKPLVPTARMVQLHRQRWEVQYRALSTLDPTLSGVAEALADRAFLDALCIAMGEAFRSGYRVLDHAPALADIADRDSGIMILMTLLAEDEMGAPAPSVAELGRRFHASRAHVLQLLKDAQASGLVARGEGAGAGRLTAAGRDALADFFASVFAVLAGAAHGALERTGGAPAGSPTA